MTDFRASFSSSFFPSSVAIRISLETPVCGAMSTFGWGGVHRLCAILLRRWQAGEIAKIPLPLPAIVDRLRLLPSAQGPTVPPDGEQYEYRCHPPPWVCILSPPF